MAQYDLDELLAQVRRIEEHREKGAEKKIRDAYREILEELRHYLADVYSRYAEDDRLNYEILQKHSYYARFLEEVEQKINELSPEAKRLIRSTVEQAYEYTYNGMIDCVKRSNIVPDIAEGLKGCTDWILKRAVENPISKLTLNDRLEKHRKEIIYDIKQDISVGLLNGDRYSTMAKRVKGSVEGDYKKAIRITRTETHRVREAGNLDAATSVQEAVDKGNVPVKMMKVWKTMRDERVRPAKSKGKNRKYDHRKMEGVSVPIDEEFTLPSGAKTMAPGQSGVAGEDINCRCYLSYKVEEEKEKTGLLTTEEVIETAKEYGDAVMSGKDRLDYNSGNVIFDYVARKRNYNQLPQVVDVEMFDKLKKESPVGVVYRGISAKTKEQALSYASDFKYGKMYSGKAYVYGSGTYFSPDEKVAQKYSQDGVMLVAILSKDAKVADYKEIIKEYSSTGADVAKLKKGNNTEAWEDILATVGEYATIKGFDVISMDGALGQNHVIVLNRGKVVIKDG